MLSTQNKSKSLPFSLSNRQNLQILSNRFTNPFKSENRTFNKSFLQILSPIFASYIMVIHGKRTTIFSIFVLLCLLPNSIYARTIEYETPKDTTLDMTLYFDLNARQVNKDYHRNGKTLTVLDSLLANPAHSIHLNSIILVSPDLYNGKKEQGIPLGQKRSEEVKVFLCGKYPQVNTAQICIRKGEEYGDALRKLILDDRLVPDREDVLALIDYHHDNPVKMQDFLQRLDAGIPYQYISDRVLPELRRTEIRVCLSYPEENGGKNSSAEQAARIEETEFIPIDRETTVTPMTMQVLHRRKEHKYNRTEKQ